MEQKKKKQVAPGVLRRKDAARKGLVELLTTTTSRFQLSMSEDDLSDLIKKSVKSVVSARGFENPSLGPEDDSLSELFARFLQQKDYHTGVLLWGKSGCGMTTRLKAVDLLMRSLLDLIPELEYSVQFVASTDLIYPNATMELYKELRGVDLLILDDLGYEQGRGKTSKLAQSLIGELLIKRHDEMHPTIISSLFDIDNLGDIYGQRVADIIRESYHEMELTTNFRRDIINARKSDNPQNYEI